MTPAGGAVRPRLADIRAAHDRIRAHIHRTPVLTCASLDHLAECELFCKCENFQKAGAFKSRGAVNAVFSLPEAVAERGVVTHSSGNHGAALARAAAARGIPATIVVPRGAPEVKIAAVRGYGAEVRLCEPTLAARESTAAEVVAETGGVLVHPYDDDRIICGQGTAALELLDDVPDLDFVLAPVGGGGLLCGTLITCSESERPVPVIACEPAAADDAYRSWRSGEVEPVAPTQTIADGLRTSLCERTLAIIRELVHEVALVGENEILSATWLLIERAKIVVEPSGAVPLAAVLTRSPRTDLRGKRVGIIISGGNVDLAALPRRG